MPNAIVTLNIRDFMPACARESFQHAAKRWGCEYIEITEPIAPIHHFWIKALIGNSKYVTGIDRILQLDGDILIRSDCPSPFDLVPRENFGVVSRVQPNNPLHKLRQLGHLSAQLFNLQSYGDEHNHINAGFILYSRMLHQEQLELWRAAGLYSNWTPKLFPEQMALSCVLQQTKVGVTWLPPEWNWLHPQKIKHRNGGMHCYIYHFNRPRHAWRELMEATQWKLP